MHTAAPTQLVGPKPYRFSVAEYDRMVDAGLFRQKRVELVEGRILLMAPQYEPHVAGVSLTARALENAFGAGFWVRRQSPIRLGKRSKPEPDVAVVIGSERDYLTSGTPTNPLLVIEVSDSTLRLDRGRKAAMYARHGVSDYWILNLVDQQLELHREPIPDPTHQFKFRYRSIVVLRPGESVSALAAPSSPVAVTDMMPFPPAAPARRTSRRR
jgi:Uma2 family endonuclease